MGFRFPHPFNYRTEVDLEDTGAALRRCERERDEAQAKYHAEQLNWSAQYDRAVTAEARAERLVEALERIAAVQDTETDEDDYTRALAIARQALSPPSKGQ